MGFPLSSYAWSSVKAGTAKGCSAVTTDFTSSLLPVCPVLRSTTCLAVTFHSQSSVLSKIIVKKVKLGNLMADLFLVCSRFGSGCSTRVSDSGRRPQCDLHRTGESERRTSDPSGGVRRERPRIRHHFFCTQVLGGRRVRFGLQFNGHQYSLGVFALTW